MKRYRLAVITLTILGLAAAGGLLAAKEPAPGESHFDKLAAKLGLTDQQKQQLKQIYTDYDQKLEPLREKLWVLRHEKWETMKQVLTEDQRKQLPTALKATWEKEWKEIAEKLALTNEQKQKIEKIHDEFARKFEQQFEQKGEKKAQQFHTLKRDFFAAVRKELNEKQRAELPAILRDEMHEWRSAEFRTEQVKAVCDQLGLNTEQRQKVQKIEKEFEPKLEKVVSQFRQTRQEECQKMEQVLTESQRVKLREFRKERSTENATEKKSD